MSSSNNYSIQHNLAQAQAAMAQLMVLTGKEATTSGKISDTQIAIADKYETTTKSVISQQESLSHFGLALAGLSVVSSALSSLAIVKGFSGLGGALGAVFKGFTHVAVPVAQGSLQCVEGSAQRKLGDTQKIQGEMGSASNVMSGQTQAASDAEAEVAQKAAAIARDLSQIVADEKSASM
jgi:hypothetical protein